MAMTRSQMETHLALNVGNRSDLGTYDTDWLNWALEDTASIRNWRAMKRREENAIRTKAEGHWYALPPDIKDLLGVYYIDDGIARPLIYEPPESFDRQFPDPTDAGTGPPRWYTWQGEFIKLYPIPDQDRMRIDIFGAFWPELFDSNIDTDCPLPRLEKALIARATAYAFRAYREWDKAGMRELEYFDLIKRYARSDGEPADWTPQYASDRLWRATSRDMFITPTALEGEAIPAATTYT